MLWSSPPPAVYHVLSLEQLTAQELLYKLAEKVGLQPVQVSCVLQLTRSGLLVVVDDTVSTSRAMLQWHIGTSVSLMPCYSGTLVPQYLSCHATVAH